MAALTPREVFTKCVEVLKAYETSLVGPDAHLVEFLAANKIEDADDVDFMTDVFLGSVRFTKMLDVVIDGFLAREGRNFLLQDKPMLRIATYMAIVVVAATGVEVLETMLFALPRVSLSKIATYLRFGWAGDALDTWVRERWCGLYDEIYVDEQLLGPLAEHRYAITELCDKMDRKLAHTTTPPSAAKPTVPVPFNLTKPKVKVIQPIVKQQPKVKVAIPKSTYKTPIEQQALERKRKQNRQKAEQTLLAAKSVKSTLTAYGESERTKALRDELRAREEAELKVKIKAKPLPTSLGEAELTVKLNTGAILREEKKIRAEMEAEAKRLAAVEAGGFDRAAFQELQEEIAAEEAARHESEVQVRHLKGLIAREDVELAKEAHASQTRKQARKVRVEREEIHSKIHTDKLLSEEQNKKRVEEAAQLQERMLKAKAAVAEQKAVVVKEVTETNRMLLQEAAAREAIEKEKRAEMIREIRALQTTAEDRVKLVDKTETSGCGFLTEMSYIELQERLAMLRVRNAREEEERRAAINREKAEAEKALTQKLRTIAQSRVARQNAAREKKPGQGLGRKVVAQDARVAALQAKLEAKRGAVQKQKAKTTRAS